MATPTADLTAELAVDWTALEQLLGHPADWPERWHNIRTRYGQAELLKAAAHDLAADLSASRSTD